MFHRRRFETRISAGTRQPDSYQHRKGRQEPRQQQQQQQQQPRRGGPTGKLFFGTDDGC